VLFLDNEQLLEAIQSSFLSELGKLENRMTQELNSLRQDSRNRFTHVEESISGLHSETKNGFQEVKNILYEDVVEITNEMVNDKDLIRREIDALKGRIYLLEKKLSKIS
jgi:predicted RNase H-like nuclease (RuvC/YqgF family)